MRFQLGERSAHHSTRLVDTYGSLMAIRRQAGRRREESRSQCAYTHSVIDAAW